MPVVMSRFQPLRHGAHTLRSQLKIWMAGPLIVGGLASVALLSHFDTGRPPETPSHSAASPANDSAETPKKKKASQGSDSSTARTPSTPSSQQRTEPTASQSVAQPATPPTHQTTSPSSNTSSSTGSQLQPSPDTSSHDDPESNGTGLLDGVVDGVLP